MQLPTQRGARSGALFALLVDGDEQFRTALRLLEAVGCELVASDHVQGDVWRLHLHVRPRT